MALEKALAVTWTPPIWVTLPGLRRYAISDRGEVRNAHGLMRTRLNEEGYPKVKLVGDDGVRKDYFVHTLVARAHLPPPRADQRYVCHINGCRTDATAVNLRWGTHAENHADKRAHGTIRPVVIKLTAKDVRAIRRSSLPYPALAKLMGLSLSHVRDIRAGRKHANTH